MTQLLLIALATFASEDLTCIATGALIASGRLSFVPGVLACVFGIFAGDLLLYFAGRLAGRPIVQWKAVRRFLTDEKLERASAWLSQRGAIVVIISRFTPGLRLPTYVAAGILRTRFWTFATYFLLASVIWTPVLVGAAALLGKSLPRLSYLGPAVLLVGLPLRSAGSWQVRRRALGWIRRRIRWEFWPPYLAYLPVIPYILYLGLKHRSLTLFTAANPGISSGGFVGESKSGILARLSEVPDFCLLAPSLSPPRRFLAVQSFLTARGFSYPVVLKPDVGERGTGVAIARNDGDVIDYMRAHSEAVIVQKYIAGLEFGIFYYRYPGQAKGHILSITEKRFPVITGDGCSTVEDLVLRDERAVCLANLYLRRLHRDAVPATGEVVALAELGSHCRGAIFLNGAAYETQALRDSVEGLAQSHDGFFFGRFDVRTPSIADLRAGRFEVLELNGVSAEATHIYDPAVSLFEAYCVLFNQWRIAFEIGALNRRAGVLPMSLRDFYYLVTSRKEPAVSCKQPHVFLPSNVDS